MDIVLRTRDDGTKVCRSRQRGIDYEPDEIGFGILQSFRPPRSESEAWSLVRSAYGVSRSRFTGLLRFLIGQGLIHESGDILERAVVIISAPRAGSTLLFESLSRSNELWSIGGESGRVIESIERFRASARDYSSNSLTAEDADSESVDMIRAGFVTWLQDHRGLRFLEMPPDDRPASVRLLEKTPRNTLRVAFMNKVFPDARFLFLWRPPRESIASIMEAWRAPGFWQFRGDLPGWDRDEWCLLLPPGWRNLVGQPLSRIAAYQWATSNTMALDALEQLPRSKWLALSYADLTLRTEATLRQISRFLGIQYRGAIQRVARRPLAHSRSVVSPPNSQKWLRDRAEIESVVPSIEHVNQRLRRLDELVQ